MYSLCHVLTNPPSPIHLTLNNNPHTLCRKWLWWKYDLFNLTMKVIFYNEFLSGSYVFEVLMTPMVWVVDHFSKALGPVSVGVASGGWWGWG